MGDNINGDVANATEVPAIPEVAETVKPSYPKIKNAILLCLLFVGIEVGLGLIFFVVIFITSLGSGDVNVIYEIGESFAYLLTFGLVLFIGYKKTHRKFNDVFMFHNVSWQFWLATTIFMFGFIILLSALDNIVQYFLPMPEFLQNTFISMLAEDYLVVSIISVAIMPAFFEEMLFRGVILSGFKENYSVKKAVLVSALLFGLIHLNPWQFVSAFIIGIVSAWICLKLKSIVLCVYIHLFNNLMAVIAARTADVVPITGFNSLEPEAIFQPLWFDAIGVVLIAVGVLLFLYSMKQQKIVQGSIDNLPPTADN